MQRFLAFILVFILAGCGAGTWEDDPKNWQRAFGEQRPADGISIVRSWYMRTPHFTEEYAWFFELRLTEKAKRDLLGSSDIRSVPNLSPDVLAMRLYNPRPAWFFPEPLTAYEAYESKSSPDFIILVQKEGNHSFWSRVQF